jgi:hypothetical protein
MWFRLTSNPPIQHSVDMRHRSPMFEIFCALFVPKTHPSNSHDCNLSRPQPEIGFGAHRDVYDLLMRIGTFLGIVLALAHISVVLVCFWSILFLRQRLTLQRLRSALVVGHFSVTIFSYQIVEYPTSGNYVLAVFLDEQYLKLCRFNSIVSAITR